MSEPQSRPAPGPQETLRDIRYQGAIVRDDHLLLLHGLDHLKLQRFWLVPGGGRLEGETEEECVRREMREETLLDVRVERLLLDDPAPQHGTYKRLKTYHCTPLGGSEGPGSEPEIEELGLSYTIEGVRWFDLRDEADWGDEIRTDEIMYPWLRQVKAALGYSSD